jgi:hypothetical protein
MVVSRDLVSLGNFPSRVIAGRSKVALRVSREVQREFLGPGLSPFGNLIMLTLMSWICRVWSTLVWRCIVRSLFYLCSPSSYRGATCFRSFLEYCIGLHYCRIIFTYSFVPFCPYSEVRFSWRALSTALDALWMLVVMSLSWWSGDKRSYSSPGMLLASLRMRSVGSLRGLDSSAS